MTWTQGRRLATMSGNGQSLSFTYNADGIRTSKTVNGITHYYHLAGTQILSEEWTDANEVQHLIIYHYDTNGQPVGMSYRNSTDYEGTYDSFLFVKNLQGDIIKVLDNEGELLVSYAYDAWGNPTSTTYSNSGASTAVVYNPFRYRGYYYDSEIGLYYLNSRYYNPAACRFINADILVSTGAGVLGYNMFAYCNNNPVKNVDPTGESLLLTIAIGIIVAGAITGGIIGGVTAAQNGGDTRDIIKSTLLGTGSGALAGSAVAMVGLVAAAAPLAAATSVQTVAQAFACSALVYDVTGIIMFAFTGVETELIELEPMQTPNISKPNIKSSKHPAYK